MLCFIQAWIIACFAVPPVFAPGSGPTVSTQERRKGEPAARQRNEVFNAVPGRTTILSIKPDGSRVEKGELVCELDPFLLKEKLAGHERALNEIETDLKKARCDREDAERSVGAYVEGPFKQELQTLNSQIALAETALKRAEDRLERTKRLFEKGIIPRGHVSDRELAVQRARLALELPKSKKMILEKFTKEKTIKTLQLNVEKARSVELTKRAEQEREQDGRNKTMKQIEDCKVLAPHCGRLIYSRPIEAAAEVDEGQLLFRVIPEDEPKAKAKPKDQPTPH